MGQRLTLPALIPVRNPAEAELAAAARASVTLQTARRLADWFGDAPVDVASGWNSVHAQRDAAIQLGLMPAGDGAVTPETASRLHWIYEVAIHSGYLHAKDHDHDVVHRAVALHGDAERTDAEIIADWRRGLDALVAHGVEQALPLDADQVPLDFDGIGGYPLFKLLAQPGTAETVSADIAYGATEGMPPSYGRQQWTEWTASFGDPTAAFLQLAAEFGVVVLDGPAVSLTPLGAWVFLAQAGAKTEELPAPGELTAWQLIICRLGMPAQVFELELQAWLAAQGDTEAAWRSAMSLPAIRPYVVAELNRRAGRDPQRDPLRGLEPGSCDAVVIAAQAIVAAYETGDPDKMAQAIRQAAAPDPETVLFEQLWRSRHTIALQALTVTGKQHPDKKIAKAARAALVKASSARSSAGPVHA
jgi:hypothetical protein